MESRYHRKTVVNEIRYGNYLFLKNPIEWLPVRQKLTPIVSMKRLCCAVVAVVAVVDYVAAARVIWSPFEKKKL